ncbi:MAG: aminoacyl-tRNA hydrolase [Oscillospiraceae bacterium]|nr:aminoacyl-tRNA hydrolase [Oscillospiraceae bacterium]
MLDRFRKSGGADWIVVFLGNPGPKYAATRHNAGFMTAAVCEKELGITIKKSRFRALTELANVGGQKVLLMKPQTFMNNSGDAVGEAAHFYKLPPERVLVVSDDISLPVAKLRVRTKGSAGGHNGLKSIIARLGSDAFPRVKIGVGAPPSPEAQIDWVLGTFKNQDAEDMARAVERAWQAVVCYITEGPEKTMDSFN